MCCGRRTRRATARICLTWCGRAEENYVVPVQLEVKEMEDQSENRLYLSVVLTKIAPEVLEKALSGKPGSIPRLFSDAKISIADIFRNVNSEDGRFLKYVPDGFLSETQKAAKKDAIRKQNKEYEQYGRRDNITELHNLTEADLEAMYESPGIPVKSMLEDEDGEGKTIWSVGGITGRSLSPSFGSSSNHSGMRRTNSGRKASSNTIKSRKKIRNSE